jgi:hypothetical protein
MNIFKLPSFLKRGTPKPEEEQGHSSEVEAKSDPEKKVGKPILAEENNDANSKGQEVPVHNSGSQGRRRRKKKAQG